MMFRILHVDDEPDIREVAGLSLGLDPQFVVRSCGCGEDAIVQADEWCPDIILLDVMMPGMDGPATLARLRENPRTADIPVLFMTARAQTRELDRFLSLGAVGVIAKPFDPMTLAQSARRYLCSARLAAADTKFRARLESDAATLERCRAALRDAQTTDLAEELRTCVHKLAGAAGIYGFAPVGCAASTLEETIVDHQSGAGSMPEVLAGIDLLLEAIDSSVRGQPAGTGRAETQPRHKPAQQPEEVK